MADVKTTTVKFGFGQIPKTTPEFAKWAFRGILYGATILNVIILTFSDIPDSVKIIVGKYSLEVVTFVHILSKMFGLDVEGPENEPTNYGTEKKVLPEVKP